MNQPGTPSEDAPEGTPKRVSPYAVLRNRSFILFLTGRFISSLAQQMLAVAVGWEIYERTHQPIYLGLVGLVQIVPMFLCTFHAGHVADNHHRKSVILFTQVALGITCAGLAVTSWLGAPVGWMYACLFAFGAARTYLWPASTSFVAQLVGRDLFPSAVNYNVGSFQVASVIGPAAGGAMIAWTHNAYPVYALNAVAALVCAILISGVVAKVAAPPREPMSWASVKTGLRFVYQTKVVLGSMTLDMFAVLLGGATAMLPIYSKDILHVGPAGLGLLQAALPLGSTFMALVMVYRPPLRKAGYTLLWTVGIFGFATIGFGLSKIFWLSMAMLFLCGASDYISVVIRHTLVQMRTPDEMRGRVSAVNSLFIGTSNQMGDFESGFVASFTGPVIAVVSGGVGTLVVVLLAAWAWPELRKYGRLDT